MQDVAPSRSPSERPPAGPPSDLTSLLSQRAIPRELAQPLAMMVVRRGIEPGAQVSVSLSKEGKDRLIRANEITQAVASSQPTILIVDDNRDLLLFLASQLVAEGWDVLTAETAQQARDLFLKRKPETVLLDDLLGKDDGFRLGLVFQAQNPEAQIIIMTGGGLTHDELMLCADRNLPVLSKPFLTDEVLNLVKAKYRRASSTAALAI